MKFITSVLKTWLPFAAAITLVCGIIYGTVQTSYRSGANDPQFQLAGDAAYALSQGTDPKLLISAKQTEISRSLSPYLIIYDDHGAAVAGDGVLDGKIPSMPSGVLDFTRAHDQDVITWQPREGVRSALVIQHVSSGYNGFVVAGRSLREVERRESTLVEQVGIGWIVSLIALLLVIAAIGAIFK